MSKLTELVNSRNFWNAILLVITALVKSTNAPMLPMMWENVVVLATTAYTIYNMASHFMETPVGEKFKISLSSNFFLQLYPLIKMVVPLITAWITEQDYNALIDAALRGDWAFCITIIGAALFKIFGSIFSKKRPTESPVTVTTSKE